MLFEKYVRSFVQELTTTSEAQVEDACEHPASLLEVFPQMEVFPQLRMSTWSPSQMFHIPSKLIVKNLICKHYKVSLKRLPFFIAGCDPTSL